jgi:hypothetical protein
MNVYLINDMVLIEGEWAGSTPRSCHVRFLLEKHHTYTYIDRNTEIC